MESNPVHLDLKELLFLNSAQEALDESSPLSAPDLHLLKDRLQVRSLHIKNKVSTYIRLHDNDFFHIISGAVEAAAKVEHVSEKLDEILGRLENVSVDVELRQVAAARKCLKKDLDEKEEVRGLVLRILEIVERLKEVERNVEKGCVVEAAKELKELRLGLRIAENWREDEGRVRVSEDDLSAPKAFNLLKDQWSSSATKLQQLLEDLFDNAVKVDNANLQLLVNLHAECGASFGGVDLSSVLMAMEIAGLLDAGFARLADSLIQHVMIPVIQNSAIRIITDEFVKNKPVLRWVLQSDMQLEGVAAAALYTKLLQVLKFVHRYICFDNGNWMKIIGRLTWPRLSEDIITNFLTKAVPDTVSEVAEFQKVVNLTKDFESELKDMMLISTSDNKDDRLSNFSLNFEVHFASKKKSHILARARQLLVKSDFKFSFDNGVELLFWPATSAVSLVATQLMEIVHEALQDACLSPTRVAVEFYHAARDALLLYRAIVPVKLAKELNSLSQAAVIVHNDCLYLAQETLGLSFEYRARFPDELKGNTVFVDLAPLFHLLAQDILNQQVNLVLSGLKEALDQANGFKNTHKKQQSEMSSLAVDQAVFLLEKVRLLWQPLLQAIIYKKAMRFILGHFFGRISSEILMLDDMAVEETMQLRELVQTALGNMSSILNSVIDEEMRVRDTAENLEKNEKTFECSWDQFAQLIPSLQKLRRITDLLDMPLKSITFAWESGELIVSGFASLEVQKLIRAIFSDTPLRKECLKRIENTEFM